MEYLTVEGVELATVGEDWPTSAGEGTFTFENLADAVTAANEDPHIRIPRGKLGHLSEVNGELRIVNPFEGIGDAAPAFGLYTNLRLTNDGAVVVADWVEVPEWLATASPSAWPSRSIEATRDVTTEGGKKYTMVITAVSSLGIYLPAVTDLDDLQRFMVQGPDEATTAAAHTPEEGRMPESTAASVDTGTVRQRFNFEWTLDNEFDGDTYWWWARSVRVDPNEIVADDDDGGIWLVPFETDGKDEITFGDPVKVREEFVPVSAAATAVLARHKERAGQRVLATNLERPEKPAPKTAASSQPDPQEDEMTDVNLDALRSKLGLPEDASTEDINEALAGGAPAADAVPITRTDEIPEPSGEREGAPAAEPAEPVAASAELPDGFVAVPASKWEEVQANSVKGAKLADDTETTRRDDTFAMACKAGKVAPADKVGLYTMHANRETRARFYTLLTASVKDGGLAPGLVPVTEIGEAGREDGVAAAAGLPASWLPNRNRAGTGVEED